MALVQRGAAVLVLLAMLAWTLPVGAGGNGGDGDGDGDGGGGGDKGCTLTPGYWKTHSQEGPAPYDNTWALVGPEEEDTPFFLSGQTWYQVLWQPTRGNAYYILARAYAAAQLNILAGASVPDEVQDALDEATDLLNTYTPAQIAALKGGSSLRASFVSLGGILDDYNNGLLGPGHCPDEEVPPGK